MRALGIDCGSVGIKAVVMDDGEIVESHYLRNSGITATLARLLSMFQAQSVDAVGATGSGRRHAAVLIGADCVRPEIEAEYDAVRHLEPRAQTILNIGGEDGKVTPMEAPYNAQMNNLCGAGTGSTLEAIAARFGVTRDEFAQTALAHSKQLDFPGKCGVFLQSSVTTRNNHGETVPDILWGATCAVARQFLTLGIRCNMRPPYVLTGAMTRNIAMVKALQKFVDGELIVPEWGPYAGAVGMAMTAAKYQNGESKFRGWEVSDAHLDLIDYTAKGCENHCQITMFRQAGKVLGCGGNRCEKCVPSMVGDKA